MRSFLKDKKVVGGGYGAETVKNHTFMHSRMNGGADVVSIG